MKENNPLITEEKSLFELAIEFLVQEDIETIRRMPIDERRKLVEARHGSLMRVISHWPFVGVDKTPQVLNKEEIEKLIIEALG